MSQEDEHKECNWTVIIIKKENNKKHNSIQNLIYKHSYSHKYLILFTDLEKLNPSITAIFSQVTLKKINEELAQINSSAFEKKEK